MRGFQLYTTGMVQVSDKHNKHDLGKVPVANAHPVKGLRPFKTLKAAERALKDYDSTIVKAKNTLGKGYTTYAEEIYLMEVEMDESGKVDHWICVWAYAPYETSVN